MQNSKSHSSETTVYGTDGSRSKEELDSLNISSMDDHDDSLENTLRNAQKLTVCTSSGSTSNNMEQLKSNNIHYRDESMDTLKDEMTEMSQSCSLQQMTTTGGGNIQIKLTKPKKRKESE